MLQKLKLSGSMKTYKTFYNEHPKKKKAFFIIGDWNAKGGSQEIPGVTSKFGLGVQNEAGQRLTVLPRENTDILFRKHKRRLHMGITRWLIPKSD